MHFCGVLLSVLLRSQCPCVALGSEILKRHLQKCSLMAVDGKEKLNPTNDSSFGLFPGYRVPLSYFIL